MKYLITGANGFIGGSLAKFLLATGNDVTAFSRKFHDDTKKELSGAKFLTGDVLDYNFSNLNDHYDFIIHLATANDIISKNRKDGILLSSYGTANILEYACSINVDKFFFFSTLQVYGSELDGRYTESSDLNPQNDYALNHIFGEQYCKLFSEQKNLKTIILRPSNIYGPFLTKKLDRWTLVPGCFCKEIINEKSITLNSSGKQFRNFISLDQICYAIDKISSLSLENDYTVLNLISKDNYTIYDIANLVKKEYQKIYNESASIKIKSDSPEKSNLFSFSYEKLESMGIDFSSGESDPEKQIRSIFSLFYK
jgi:UDP-glucose 4-epimerase